MNREQIVEIMAEGICQTEAYQYIEGFGYSDAKTMANAAYNSLAKAGLLLNAEAGTNGQEDTKNDGNAV